MSKSFYQEQLKIFEDLCSAKILDKCTRGIEKENIRTDINANSSKTMHPKDLGSALTHPFITTDFSENLIEVITPPITGVNGREKLFKNLSDITAFVNHVLLNQKDKEYLWPYSMPYLPNKDSAEDISIADYGTSNIGKMKKIYRQGLVNRYGKPMQMISGLHYNFSFPEELILALGELKRIPKDEHLTPERALITQRYLGVFRNFLQYQWIIPFLFGASPVCFDGSLYEINKPCFLDKKSKNSLFSSGATSLRLSDIGYQNKSQAHLQVGADKISNYASSLLHATELPYSDFEMFPIKDENGEYQQLSSNLLQIENEFYSTIRPKAVAQDVYRPAVALHKLGVEYLEIRSLDLNPFEPLGLSEKTSAFLDLFLTHLLLQESEFLTNRSQNQMSYNFKSAVNSGRKVKSKICIKNKNNNSCDSLVSNAKKLLESMRDLANIMDKSETNSNNIYTKSLQEQLDKVNDLSLLPSNQVISKWQESGLDFEDFISKIAQDNSLKFNLADKIKEQYQLDAKESLLAQTKLEQDDIKSKMSFEDFLDKYFEQKL
jgi:glutamate--cysteine ligase